MEWNREPKKKKKTEPCIYGQLTYDREVANM